MVFFANFQLFFYGMVYFYGNPPKFYRPFCSYDYILKFKKRKENDDILRSPWRNWFLPKTSFFGSIYFNSGKRAIFWDHFEKIVFCQKNCFFSLSPKVSIFRGKGHYFQFTLKKFNFAYKIIFWLYLVKYQYWREKDDILRSPWKIVFSLNFLNYQYFKITLKKYIFT